MVPEYGEIIAEYEAQQRALSIRRSRSTTASSLGESSRLSPASDPPLYCARCTV